MISKFERILSSCRERRSYLKLHVVVEQDEAGYYFAEVPALPGCLSQGKSRQEAIKNIHEAVEGWLEVMESKRKMRKKKLVEVSV